MSKNRINFIIFFIIIFSTFKLKAIDFGDDPCERVISILEEAMIDKSIDKLQKCIAPDFSVSVASMPSAVKYIESVFKQSKAIDSIRLVLPNEVSKTDNGELSVQALFYIDGQEAVVSGICLNDDYKIKYVDYFDHLYGMFRNKPAELIGKIPFEYVNDAIIVTLRINDSDRPLRFLFDTGADGMAITKQLATSLKLTVDREKSVSVVGTSRNISISANNTVHLDTITLDMQSIAIFEEMGDKDGVIGLNLAKEFIVKADFNKSELQLYSMGNFTPDKHTIRIPITIPHGIIQIPSTLNLLGKKEINANFAFDTGAGFHVVVFSPFVRRNRLLLSGFKYESQSSMMSMGHATQVYHGKAAGFTFGSIEFSDIPIILQASSENDDWDPDAAGSIGIKLISDYNFTIDLVRKVLYFDKI